MSGIRIIHTASAGFILSIGETCIAVDALHRGLALEGYPGVTDALWERIRAGRVPEMAFFTHCHPDHFSYELAEWAQADWKKTTFLLPERRLDRQILLQGAEISAHVGDVSLRFVRLPHEAKEFRAVPHYGLIARWEAGTLLAAGDCEIASPALACALDGTGVDVAVLNYPWICLQAGRRFIRETLQPKHLLIGHFPAHDADVYGYYEKAKRARDRYFADMDVRLLTEPLQTEIIQ